MEHSLFVFICIFLKFIMQCKDTARNDKYFLVEKNQTEKKQARMSVQCRRDMRPSA